MTSYRDDDHSSRDSPFGVQVHHPRFLEWVDAPESAHLLGQLHADWLQVMTRRDALHAALQLQRDTCLLSSNLTVLHQYASYVDRSASLHVWQGILPIWNCQ